MITNNTNLPLCLNTKEPKYNLEQIRLKKENLEFLFFWGHQSNEITKSCLSQWWASDFCVGDNKYWCMEQYMMAEKARLFSDKKILEQILNSNSQHEIKSLGRKVKNFVQEVWDKAKHSIILTGSYYKFTQNDKLKEFLIGTGDKILVEASPYDAVWGIKMDVNDKDINNPLKWRGRNMLGFALMEVRDEIKKIDLHDK